MFSSKKMKKPQKKQKTEELSGFDNSSVLLN